MASSKHIQILTISPFFMLAIAINMKKLPYEKLSLKIRITQTSIYTIIQAIRISIQSTIKKHYYILLPLAISKNKENK